ncbi:unnamed protein product [Discosporangium mesarthrocarpum]
MLWMLTGQVAAVPSKVDSINVAESVFETILDRTMDTSTSVSEVVRRKTVQTQTKSGILSTFNALSANRGDYKVPQSSEEDDTGAIEHEKGVGVAPVDGSKIMNCIGSGEEEDGSPAEPPTAASPGSITALQSSNATPGSKGQSGVGCGEGQVVTMMRTFALALGGKGGQRFVNLGEEVKVLVRWYYSQPRFLILEMVKKMPSWARLLKVWFLPEGHSDVRTDGQKAVLLQECVVEVLDKEREAWVRQEKERRGMFNEEEKQRRMDESLRRAVERRPREQQETGHHSFCQVLDNMERRHCNLSRLRWEFTPEGGDVQGLTARVRDATTNCRYICRVIPCQTQQEVDYILEEASRIQDIKNPNLVKVKDVFPHRLAIYAENGEQTTCTAVVLILIEHCAGGRLEDYVAMFRPTTRLPVASGIGGTEKQGFDRVCYGLKEGNKIVSTQQSRAIPGYARKLEGWVRQIAHALTALHKEGGVHRNINAGNIYLDEKGRAKLGGYQCLKAPKWPGFNSMRSGFGCTATIPPEYQNQGDTTPKGDIWSLGCAIYMWTTGLEFSQVPLGNSRMLDKALLRVPHSCGKKIKDALRMCLQRDPRVRVSSEGLWQFMSANSSKTTSGKW